MDAGKARFWTTMFGGITSIGLIVGGVYTLFQYFDTKDKDRNTLRLQIAATTIEAKKDFNDKHMELCFRAVEDVGVISSSNIAKLQEEKQDDFWRLLNGPLAVVEKPGSSVEQSMKNFGK